MPSRQIGLADALERVWVEFRMFSNSVCASDTEEWSSPKGAERIRCKHLRRSSCHAIDARSDVLNEYPHLRMKVFVDPCAVCQEQKLPEVAMKVCEQFEKEAVKKQELMLSLMRFFVWT